MYSIDGVPLANTTYGWRLKLAGTNPYGPRSKTLMDFNSSGRDGTIQTRGFIATPTVTFVVTSPSANLEKLYKLLRLGASLTLTTDSTKAAVCELVSLTTTPMTVAGTGIFAVTVVLRLPEVYWRAVSTTTSSSASITSSGQTFTVFTNSTAPIRDALISIGGSITGLAVQAQNGTFYTYAPNVPVGTFLTFDSTSGRAWTGSSAFTETTEVTTSIANGPGPYFLELMGSSNPATTGSSVVVTYTAASGATFLVRGRDSFDH